MGITRDSPGREPETAQEFELLYERLRLPVYRVIRGIVLEAQVAERLTQRAFDRAFAAQPSRPGAGPSVWVYRIAVEVALAHLRGPWWRRIGLGGLGGLLRGRPARRPPSRSSAEAVLAGLAPRLRALVVLAFYARLSQHELASALQLPPAVVKVQLELATEAMRAVLDATDQAGGRERLNG
jgi:DNA-directed RNA polymerase specialized sigma24 family protein